MDRFYLPDHRTRQRRAQQPVPRSGLTKTCGSVVLIFTMLGQVVAESSAPDVDFATQVRPILEKHCFACHGEMEREGGLRLTNRRDAFTDADSGQPVIVPGRPVDSPLIDRISSSDADSQMPPPNEAGDNRLSNAEIKTLRDWISAGADWPAETTEKHWAYIKPNPRDLPDITLSNPIDHFVSARLADNGVTLAEEEQPARLIRRAYLALTGLPPTIEQVDEFVADPSPAAYEKIVDRLLASPGYGERWAQPWLDLARYADSNGFQADQLRDSWAYRDWVIQAMNDDMPFDQFTIEQLAGDLLPNATDAQKIATGFHRTVPCNVEAGVHPEENRVNQIFDRVNTTGTVFLGTTIECCQCHNHKYDPFTQDEYYQLFAYFNNTPLEVKRDAGVQWNFYGPKMLLPERISDRKGRVAALEEKIRQLREQKYEILERIAPKLEKQEAALAKALRSEGDLNDLKDKRQPPDEIQKIVSSNEERTAAQKKRLANWLGEPNPEIKKIREEIKTLQGKINTLPESSTLVMQEMDEPRETRKLMRGDYLNPGKPLEPGVPQALHPIADDLPKNRLGLARWIVSSENPLIGRVTVNRWWAAFFGHGLVGSGEDFGTQSESPTHPRLLDWMATQLTEKGWSRKRIHKLIVMSATFRQSNRLTSELREKDPRNALYARGPRFRMPAEMIRDNGLAISGLLSRRMGGPPIMPYQPDRVWRAVGRNAPLWQAAKSDDRFRRGVYVVWRRAAPYPSFVNFDAPDRAACVVNRTRTNTPLQALTLLNDQAYLEMALALADNACGQSNVRDRLRYIFRRCVSRSPASDELAMLEDLYTSEHQRFTSNAGAAKKLVQSLTKGTEIETTHADQTELAALTLVANAVLNLDETINY